MHDLPQLYQKPTAETLVQILESLTEDASSFSQPSTAELAPAKVQIDPVGLPRYLTSIVSSSLSWIEDDGTKERIWELASVRLSERSGRNAMPSMTRSFHVTDELTVRLHEPSMTGDSLGLKTWTSSLVLSRLLPALQKSIPNSQRLLELGAGTGLLGISAACLWQADVLLTDLPEVVSNLESNLQLNSDLVKDHEASVSARALDWSDDTDLAKQDSERYQVILAADPIYSPDHPPILVSTISRWLKPDTDSRLIIALPLRGLYKTERSALRTLLAKAGLTILEQGTGVGYDDWYTNEGKPAEVECWWSVWQPDAA